MLSRLTTTCLSSSLATHQMCGSMDSHTRRYNKPFNKNIDKIITKLCNTDRIQESYQKVQYFARAHVSADDGGVSLARLCFLETFRFTCSCSFRLFYFSFSQRGPRAQSRLRFRWYDCCSSIIMGNVSGALQFRLLWLIWIYNHSAWLIKMMHLWC